MYFGISSKFQDANVCMISGMNSPQCLTDADAQDWEMLCIGINLYMHFALCWKCTAVNCINKRNFAALYLQVQVRT